MAMPTNTTTMRLTPFIKKHLDERAARYGISRAELVRLVLIDFIAAPSPEMQKNLKTLEEQHALHV